MLEKLKSVFCLTLVNGRKMNMKLGKAKRVKQLLASLAMTVVAVNIIVIEMI